MNLTELQQNPQAFRNALLIGTDAGPKPLKDVVDDWQAADFQAMDDGWLRAVNGIDHEARYSRAWIERGRGHSKSQDNGLMAAWALFAARRPIRGIAAAGDKDQARLLRDAIQRLVWDNEWLGQLLDVQQFNVVNKHTGSRLDIIASDVASSWGHLCDFVLCDEVSAWPKRDLWDSLLSTAAKKANCVLVCILNAGLEDDWAYKTREAIRDSEDWYFSRLDGPVASWISPKLLDEQRRLLPEIAYRRLWLNEWTSGLGDFLSDEIIAEAFHDDHEEMHIWEPGYRFVGGLDLGVKRDSSALVVLGVPPDGGPVCLAYHKVWAPSLNSKVDLEDVERTILQVDQRYDLEHIGFDPWNAELMVQRLERISQRNPRRKRQFYDKPWMVEVPPSPGNLRDIASRTMEYFQDRKLRLYDCPPLLRDIQRLRVEEKSYGFRLVSPRDEHGHGDCFSAFANALLVSHTLAGEKPAQLSDSFF